MLTCRHDNGFPAGLERFLCHFYHSFPIIFCHKRRHLPVN
ncbi:hypothetical protein HMPREF9080_00330 [Cardiobacterium valvarum F0432]|uniref:Uncharacterized protein n=1 Tax=Cardiobacterium valvarum F0432 TaxID=797473 RepID=G9ZC53_9GAMM|nr:hypothetical protein HMPREF9080_00330 [Cardiobacterium valvarum F0432]